MAVTSEEALLLRPGDLEVSYDNVSWCGVTEQESQEWDFTAHQGDISTDSLSDLDSQNVSSSSFPLGEGVMADGSEVAPLANEEEHATFVFSNGEDTDSPAAPGDEARSRGRGVSLIPQPVTLMMVQYKGACPLIVLVVEWRVWPLCLLRGH